MNKLLKEAQKHSGRPKRNHTIHEIELALAWLQGDISYTGVTRAINQSGSTVYGFLAVCLLEAHRRKLLAVKKVHQT